MKAVLLVTVSLLAAAPAAAQEDPPIAVAAQGVPSGDAQEAHTDPQSPTMPPAAPNLAGQDSSSDDEEDVVVTGRDRAPPGDPLEAINLQSYEVVQAVDTTVVAPMANGYKKLFPEPMRAGVRNFFGNLAAPATFLNFLLQHKIGKAAETVGRFGLNSTIGVAGLFDVAKRKPFKLPPRRNGFANTLGFYGVKPGPFLFLPLVGPTTVRDLIGLTFDRALLPLTVGAPFGQPYYTIPSTAVSSLDYRVEFDEQLRKLRDTPDPYAASRAFYLRNRQAEIDALRHPQSVVPPLPQTGPLVQPAEADEPVNPEDEGAPPAQDRF